MAAGTRSAIIGSAGVAVQPLVPPGEEPSGGGVVEDSMALNIKSAEAHRLAKALAEATGTTLTDAVTSALRDRVRAETEHEVEDESLLLAEVAEIQKLVAALLDRDTRPADEILGYDSFGLPG